MDNGLTNREASVKRILIKAIVDQLIEDYGQVTFRKIIGVIGPEYGTMIEPGRINEPEYPAGLLKALAAAITDIIPPAGPEPSITELVRKVSHRHLSMAMTIVLKVGTPSFIVRHFPGIWNMFFNRGMMLVKSLAGNTADIELIDNQDYDQGICAGTIGWLRGAVEKSGGKNVAVSHTMCRFRGEQTCLFKLRWD